MKDRVSDKNFDARGSGKHRTKKRTKAHKPVLKYRLKKENQHVLIRLRLKHKLAY